ncbi:hypothetical protein DPMN_141014 [Dreissena polymorpha]|uniref:Uncharacterized protein n=1 Tax=Dreissena polymorpha TaxID=45954 RepID=A0A9D4GBZ5_DREPO|nr:hypothetical protein DPMN_141014 [Dreissena polymorpha]
MSENKTRVNASATSGAILPVAVATLFQSGCFLAAAVLKKNVNFLPKDPLVLIGTVYALAATDMFAYSWYISKNNDKDNKQ